MDVLSSWVRTPLLVNSFLFNNRVKFQSVFSPINELTKLRHYEYINTVIRIADLNLMLSTIQRRLFYFGPHLFRMIFFSKRWIERRSSLTLLTFLVTHVMVF